MSTELRAYVFGTFVQTFLPIRIAEYQRRGGPTDADFERIATYADEFASRADIFMGQGKPGEAGALAGKILDAMAVLSFLPGESQNGNQLDSIGRWIEELKGVRS